MTDGRVTTSNDDAQPAAESLREILRERAMVLSEIPAQEESGKKISVLSFCLAEELYGVELSHLTETRQSISLRHIPRGPSYLAGIVNLRGEFLPVIDLCPILGLAQQKFGKNIPALLILSLQGNKLALAAERAEDILTFPMKELKPPPISLEAERGLFIKGELLVNNRPLSLLDVEKLLQELRLAGENPNANPSTEGEMR